MLFLDRHFILLLVFFCLLVINGWILAFLFGEKHTPFYCLEHSSFHSYGFVSVWVFATAVFSSCFPFIFCLEPVSLINLDIISSLVFNEYFLGELFQIS